MAGNREEGSMREGGRACFNSSIFPLKKNRSQGGREGGREGEIHL